MAPSVRRDSLLVLGLAGCGGGDRKAYVKANETLFEQLPRFPGSRVENETTTAYRADESGPVAGYSTRFDLKLRRRPPPATWTRSTGGASDRSGGWWRTSAGWCSTSEKRGRSSQSTSRAPAPT